MITSFIAVRNRGLALLSAVSMYRLTLYALISLAIIAVLQSFFGSVGSTAPEILASAAVLLLVTQGVDAAAQRLLRLPRRIESSLITALILLFVVQPGFLIEELGGIALAGALASASKYLIVWRGRHIVNPAAFGAAVVTIIGWGSYSSWWVATPAMLIPVVFFGLLVLWRAERLRVALLFVVVATSVAVLRDAVQSQQFGLEFSLLPALTLVFAQSPVLFLGAFMLSEPLTMPPRRWQQYSVAALVGVLVGWPIMVAGLFSLGQERALLIGNLLAFAFGMRRAARLVVHKHRAVTSTVQEITFRAKEPLRFLPGQYLELQVPHRRPDARGTRREFSIVSTPEELPELRITYRQRDSAQASTYKSALAAVLPGTTLTATGVWGDFVLPRVEAPVVMVAAGIGITPFISQLWAGVDSPTRDTVLVYVVAEASEIAYRTELEACGVRVIVFCRDAPVDLPAHWTWAGGERLSAELLTHHVTDLSQRRAYISGPPGLIADLAPALRTARSVKTDAFAGY